MSSGSRKAPRRQGALLIVDDDEHMGRLLASLGRSLGYQKVLQESTIAGALECLQVNTISAAVVDLVLGPEDGSKIIAAVRTHARSFVRDTPIVALSGAATQPRVVDALVAGADTFMSKPITVAKFEKHLWIAASKPRRAPEPAAPPMAPPVFEID